MSIENIKNQLPDFAKDIKLNLATVLTEEGAPDLSRQQIYSIAIASAHTCKNRELIAALQAEPDNPLSQTERDSAQAASVIMAMNNIYYRFVHLSADKSYAKLPARLRMNVISNPGMNKVDFELASLAVSAINGCGMCMDAHSAALEKHGVTKLAIQSTVRIAAVIHAASLAL